MTTKGNSNENYCVCREKIASDMSVDDMLEKEYDLYDPNVLERHKQAVEVLSLRRITATNQLIFRLNNYIFYKKYVKYYTKYFIKYIGI
jgi:hypothetical protein